MREAALVAPYLHRRPDLHVDPTEAQLFRAQRSRPWVGVISFGSAAPLRYLVSPVLAIPLFAWMIVYHAATSKGLQAKRIARLFTPRRPGHTVGPAGKREDGRPGPRDRNEPRTEGASMPDESPH